MIQPPLFQSTSRLKLDRNEDEVVISCRGAGPTFGVVLSLATWSLLTLGGSILFLLILIAPIRAGEVEIYNYLFALAVSLIPVGIGCIFLLQSFQRGWNAVVVTISFDRIAVRYEGKFSEAPYSFPLSQAKKMAVIDNRLHIMFWFRDYRVILPSGSEAELEWIESLILERMQLGGWRCGKLEDW